VLSPTMTTAGPESPETCWPAAGGCCWPPGPVGRVPFRHRGRESVEWLVEAGFMVALAHPPPVGLLFGFPDDAAIVADAVRSHLGN
jgi:hypothetical protein